MMTARYFNDHKGLGLVRVSWVRVRVSDWTVGIAGLRISGYESKKTCCGE